MNLLNFSAPLSRSVPRSMALALINVLIGNDYCPQEKPALTGIKRRFSRCAEAAWEIKKAFIAATARQLAQQALPGLFSETALRQILVGLCYSSPSPERMRELSQFYLKTGIPEAVLLEHGNTMKWFLESFGRQGLRRLSDNWKHIDLEEKVNFLRNVADTWLRLRDVPTAPVVFDLLEKTIARVRNKKIYFSGAALAGGFYFAAGNAIHEASHYEDEVNKERNLHPYFRQLVTASSYKGIYCSSKTDQDCYRFQPAEMLPFFMDGWAVRALKIYLDNEFTAEISVSMAYQELISKKTNGEYSVRKSKGRVLPVARAP